MNGNYYYLFILFPLFFLTFFSFLFFFLFLSPFFRWIMSCCLYFSFCIYLLAILDSPTRIEKLYMTTHKLYIVIGHPNVRITHSFNSLTTSLTNAYLLGISSTNLLKSYISSKDVLPPVERVETRKIYLVLWPGNLNIFVDRWVLIPSYVCTTLETLLSLINVHRNLREELLKARRPQYWD